MSGATVYAQLMDRALQKPSEEIAAELRGYLAATERDLTQRLVEMLRGAYVEGVRDGFHEGLATSSTPPETPVGVGGDLTDRAVSPADEAA